MQAADGDARTVLRAAVDDVRVIDRYRAKVRRLEGWDCWFWIGAVSSRGHGRLWLTTYAGRDRAVIAHRYGFALAFGVDVLEATEVVAHRCDNPLCQRPDHWQVSTHAANRAEWAARRRTPAGPLRDVRGARTRALAVRDAVRSGHDLQAVLDSGTSELDRDQLPLWT